MEKLILSSLVLSLLSDDQEADDDRIEQAENFSITCGNDLEALELT
mgnify:CR=1 FL=1